MSRNENSADASTNHSACSFVRLAACSTGIIFHFARLQQPSISICYYTFWSGVAGLSARLPEGAYNIAPEGGARRAYNRNTTTKGVIKCLLPMRVNLRITCHSAS